MAINESILQKLNNATPEEDKKEFLRKILFFESGEPQWYLREYENQLSLASEKLGDKK